MINRYSWPILVLMTGLIGLGGLMGIFGNLWGIIPFILGLLILNGFRILKESPRQVGLLSFLGVKTDIKVEGLIFTFTPFGWKILDVVIFEMRKEDMPFAIDRVTCNDGGVVTGTVSMSISPDDSTGDDLKDFDDIGQKEGVKRQLDDILEVGVQKIADGNTSQYMTTKGVEMGKTLRNMIEGKSGNDSDDNDDKRKLGIKIYKLQIKLFKTKEVIEAEQQTLVTDSINQRIEKRLKFYKSEKVSPLPSAREIRAEILEEDRNAKGNIKEVRGGGINVNET